HLGVTLWRVWPAAQIAEIGGAAAVSAVVVLANMLVADVVAARLARGILPRRVTAGAGVLVALVTAGTVRGLAVMAARRRAPVVRVAVVQPNFGVMAVEARAARGLGYVRVLRRETT